MEFKEKIGDKVKCNEFKDIMGGDTMTLYAVTFTYIGDNGVTQERKFRMSSAEEDEAD